MEVSDDTKVAMPIRNIISIVGAVAVSTWAYSGVIERLNIIETNQEVKTEAIELNSEFRINWPRGTMGSLPSDASQDREIQALQLEIERIMEEVEENDTWIDEFQPPVSVQESVETVRALELQIVVMQHEMDMLRNHVNEMHRDNK
jgi:DNA repair exonuclease SbcCD nuclease subunit